MVDVTPHALGCTVAPFPIVLPLYMFFYLVKRILKNAAAVQQEGLEAVTGVVWFPTKNWVSWMLKVVVNVSIPPVQ